MGSPTTGIVAGSVAATAQPTLSDAKRALTSVDNLRSFVGDLNGSRDVKKDAAMLRSLVDAAKAANPPVSADVARELVATATQVFAGVPRDTTLASMANLTDVPKMLVGAGRLVSQIEENTRRAGGSGGGRVEGDSYGRPAGPQLPGAVNVVPTDPLNSLRR